MPSKQRSRSLCRYSRARSPFLRCASEWDPSKRALLTLRRDDKGLMVWMSTTLMGMDNASYIGLVALW